MVAEHKLKASLRGCGFGDHEILIHQSGGGRVVVVVRSARFEGMPEERRQNMVWDALLARLSDEEVMDVEYVFTKSLTESVRDERV